MIEQGKNIYTLKAESYNQTISITGIVEDGDDDIYTMGKLIKQFLVAMSFSEGTIEHILKLENIDY